MDRTVRQTRLTGEITLTKVAEKRDILIEGPDATCRNCVAWNKITNATRQPSAIVRQMRPAKGVNRERRGMKEERRKERKKERKIVEEPRRTERERDHYSNIGSQLLSADSHIIFSISPALAF